MIDATMLWPLCQIIARCEIAVAGDYRPHASRRSRLHIPFRIAHIQTSCWVDAEQLSGMQQWAWMGFAFGQRIAAHNAGGAPIEIEGAQ